MSSEIPDWDEKKYSSYPLLFGHSILTSDACIEDILCQACGKSWSYGFGSIEMQVKRDGGPWKTETRRPVFTIEEGEQLVSNHCLSSEHRAKADEWFSNTEGVLFA